MPSERGRRRRLAPAVLLGLALLLGAAPGPAGANDLRVGQPAPPATMQTLDGRRITTRELLGHPVILAFWASWCETCRSELPLLARYAAAHRDDGLIVLGLNVDDAENLDKVRALAGDLGFPVSRPGQWQAPGYGRIWRLPVSFVIDARGVLRDDGWKARPAVWNQQRLDEVVGPLLATRPEPAAP